MTVSKALIVPFKRTTVQLTIDIITIIARYHNFPGNEWKEMCISDWF